MSEGKSKSFLFGATLGALAGAALAFLYAPQKGEKTRQQIKDKSSKLKAKMDKIQTEIEEKGGFLKLAADTADELMESLSESAQIVSQETKEEIEALGKKVHKKKPRFFKGV